MVNYIAIFLGVIILLLGLIFISGGGVLTVVGIAIFLFGGWILFKQYRRASAFRKKLIEGTPTNSREFTLYGKNNLSVTVTDDGQIRFGGTTHTACPVTSVTSVENIPPEGTTLGQLKIHIHGRFTFMHTVIYDKSAADTARTIENRILNGMQ